MLSERDGCLSEPITRANYLEKLFLLTEWEQHSHMEALEKYVCMKCMVHVVTVSIKYSYTYYYATSEYVYLYIFFLIFF